MPASKLSSLPSLRRQELLVEFAGLKQSCPDGVFVSLTPGDPSLWSGVIFIRSGPYAPAILRFHISFPDTYPRLPPLVTFSTDMFHPLITPLTTYMYTTDPQDGGTVSAADQERLPPGGFSLRNGFPDWFGRGRCTAGSRQTSGQQQVRTPPRQGRGSLSSDGTPNSRVSAVGDSPGFAETRRKEYSTFEVLRYIRNAFYDEEILDSIPLEAAGNSGAWHAWRTHRLLEGKVFPDMPAATEDAPARKPGDWNWEGVWEERVKKGVDASLSEAVLYGAIGATDDVIRFQNLEEDELETMKDNLLKTVVP